MKYYVYYSDGYSGDGDVGLAEFETKEQALGYIGGRAESHGITDPSEYYTLIEGSSLALKTVKVVTKVEVE